MHRQPSSIVRAAFVGTLLTGTCLATAPAKAQQGNVIDVGAEFENKTIQQAMSRARPGTVVRVHPGTYSGVQIDKDNVTLQSVTPGGAHIVGGNRPAIESYSQSGVTVEGFRLSSDVDGVKIGGSMSGAARNIKFLNNTVEGAGGDGLKFFQTEGLMLQNNTIKKAGLNRNSNGDGGIDLVGVDNGIIEGNEVVRTFGHACLMVKGGSERNEIRNNKLLGCERDGITVGGFTDAKFMVGENAEAHNNTITGNTVQGGDGKCPFYFNDAKNNRIENNRTIGGRADCDMANGSNNTDANVNTDTAGADNAGDDDLYQGTPSGRSGGDDDTSVSDILGPNPSCNISSVAHSIGGGAISSSVGSVVGGATDIATGVLSGGIGSIVSGIGSIFGGGGGRASEKMQKVQQVQLFFQSLCDAEQAAIAAKHITNGTYNNSFKVERGIRRTGNLIKEVMDIDFAGLFPDEYGVMSSDDKIIWDEKQTARQYGASDLSKRTALEASINMQEMGERSKELIEASKKAEGVLSIGQVNVAASAMNLEVLNNTLSTQIAHNQVVEAHLDKQTAAEMRAIEYRKRMRRGLPGYEGDGGLGILLSGDE